MAESVIYRSATTYDAVMRLLYGRHANVRFAIVADLIPDGATVVELCCGPGHLWRDHLRDRRVAYTGLDVNPRFVEVARRAGVPAYVRNVADGDALPAADVVVMQAALYHFLPDPAPLMERMLAAAHRRVILSEPIRNLASSRFAPVAALARRGADPGTGHAALRFDEASLDAFVGRFPAPIERAFVIPGGRDKVFVLDTTRSAAVVPEVVS